MFFGYKKEKEIEKQLKEHYSLVREVLVEFILVVETYFADKKEFKDHCLNVHNKEGEADYIRRTIEAEMCTGVFLPELREDYIHLIELVDLIANKAERISDDIILTRPEFPDFIQKDYLHMAEITLKAIEPIGEMFDNLGGDYKDIFSIAKKVQDREEDIDNIQWEIVKAVSKSDLSLAHKIQLKMLIDKTAMISNHIEDVSDKFIIMVIKRIV